MSIAVTAEIRSDPRGRWWFFRVPVEIGSYLAELGRQVAEEVKGTPEETDHITACYVTKAEVPLGDGDVQEIVAAAQKALSSMGPVDVWLGGTAYFDTAQDYDNKPATALVALVDGPGLVDIHVALKKAMHGIGIDWEEKHTYVPHATIAYLPVGARSMRLPKLEEKRWRVDSVFLGNRDPFQVKLDGKPRTFPKHSKIISIDFDGIISDGKFPDIGNPLPGAFEVMKELEAAGHRLVLNTCREGEELAQAVEFCRAHGIEFRSVNENHPDDEFRDVSGRKLLAHYYIDDRNLGGFPGWEVVREHLIQGNEVIQLADATIIVGDGEIWQPSAEELETLVGFFRQAAEDPVGAVVAIRGPAKVFLKGEMADKVKVTVGDAPLVTPDLKLVPTPESTDLSHEPSREPHLERREPPTGSDPVLEPENASRYVDGLDPWRPIDAVVREVARPGDRINFSAGVPAVSADVTIVRLASDVDTMAAQLDAALKLSKMVIAWCHLSDARPGVLAAGFQPTEVAIDQHRVLVMRGTVPPTMKLDLDAPQSERWNPHPGDESIEYNDWTSEWPSQPPVPEKTRDFGPLVGDGPLGPSIPSAPPGKPGDVTDLPGTSRTKDRFEEGDSKPQDPRDQGVPAKPFNNPYIDTDLGFSTPPENNILNADGSKP